jgi:hypothetical protein
MTHKKAKEGFKIIKTTDPITGTTGVFMPIRTKGIAKGRPIQVGMGEPFVSEIKQEAIDFTYEVTD